MSDTASRQNWSELALHPGALREMAQENQRLVVWVPAERGHAGQYWQRVSTVSDAAVVECGDLCSIAATAIRARQRSGGLFSRFLQRFRGDEDTWRLPTGQEVEQEGNRRRDLLLVWPKDEAQHLDEAQVLARWPGAQAQSLGPRLVLVLGVVVATDQNDPPPVDECSIQIAEQRLAAARQQGDRAQEILALVDLGLWALDQGQIEPADVHLQEALALARALGDRGLLADVLSNLGLVALKRVQAEPAGQYLQEASYLSFAAGDPVTEKLALERLATVQACQGDTPGAVGSLSRAIELARKLGDRQHAAELLWQQAILRSETGQAEEALRSGQAAIEMLQALGRPQAQVYAEHLANYQRGEQGQGDQSAVSSPAPGALPAAGTHSGPGSLRMAISAAQAFVQSEASGMKPVSPETLQGRMEVCRPCSYYRGLRCRVCGCFAGLRARVPHEDCPLGYWPSDRDFPPMREIVGEQVLTDPSEIQEARTYMF